MLRPYQYIATNGSDANPGTRGRPFRTFERARDAVRGAGQTKARKVTVRGGVYEFSASFTLRLLDSGTPKHPVIEAKVTSPSPGNTSGERSPVPDH